MRTALTIGIATFCLAVGCDAATPPSMPAGLVACSKIADPAKRVHCYDAQVAQMQRPQVKAKVVRRLPAASDRRSPPAAAPKTPASSVIVAADRQTATDAQFGAEDLPVRKREGHRDFLLSSITALHALGENRYLISLADGQVWRQEEADQVALFFRVGDRVRIERGALGSYHLSTSATGEKNWVQVTRVQ